MRDIHPSLTEVVTFTKEWFERELEKYFEKKCLCYNVFPLRSLPEQRNIRCKRKGEFEVRRVPVHDVSLVFVAGGTCKIPFVQRWIQNQFPKAKLIIGNQLEVITATGATIHALQILNGEVEPYVMTPKPRTLFM